MAGLSSPQEGGYDERPGRAHSFEDAARRRGEAANKAPTHPAGIERRVSTTPAVGYLKMFTARAATRSTVTEDTVASLNINDFARRVRGMASVGEKAIEFVKATYM
jgi:hypothetical protein